MYFHDVMRFLIGAQMDVRNWLKPVGFFRKDVHMSCHDRIAKHLLCCTRGNHSKQINFISMCGTYYNCDSTDCEDTV
jgi:hypothetical protein